MDRRLAVGKPPVCQATDRWMAPTRTRSTSKNGHRRRIQPGLDRRRKSLVPIGRLRAVPCDEGYRQSRIGTGQSATDRCTQNRRRMLGNPTPQRPSQLSTDRSSERSHHRGPCGRPPRRDFSRSPLKVHARETQLHRLPSTQRLGRPRIRQTRSIHFHYSGNGRRRKTPPAFDRCG